MCVCVYLYLYIPVPPILSHSSSTHPLTPPIYTPSLLTTLTLVHPSHPHTLTPPAQAPHRVMHNLSGAGNGAYPTSQQGPTHVDSVTSVTTALSGLSGLSSHSTNSTDMSPERAAQSK